MAMSVPRRRRSVATEARIANESSGVSTEDTPASLPYSAASERSDPAFVMERPSEAQRRKQRTRVAWRMPAPLMISIMLVFFLSLAAFTAQSLMQAYLTRQAEKHQREEEAVLSNYPLEFRTMIESED